MENNIGRILDGLDRVQREAVECEKGPVLIVAGAGSGKTRVLTGRIAYVLEKGCLPDRILALTFTKKAAGEMKERIGAMVGELKARRLCMGTFHSVFIRFLREYADRLGYPQSFTIYDTSDSQSAIKRCIKELGLDDKTYKPKSVLSRISAAKNELWTPASYRRDVERMKSDAYAKMPRVCDIYEAYQKLMKQSGVMDFDDILLNMNILLKNHPDALESIAGRFDYILVDEYQDTNYSQYLILKKLSAAHRNICVVGDDSQSIYAFRGARIQNILNFGKDYPECRIFKLVNNYRSTGNIVGAANSVIAHNEGRIPKDCLSTGAQGEKIHLMKAYTDREEASMVTSSILRRLADEGAMYRDFAVLYRTNSQSRVLEEALRKRNVPYRIYSGNSFFDRAEIKDMMAYFKLAVNPGDNESFRRVVNTPARGIGETTVNALAAAALDKGVPMLKAVSMEGLEAYGLKPAAVKKLREFCAMILKANSALGTSDAFAVATELSNDCGLYASFKMENSVESMSRAGNLEELMNSVSEFVEKRKNDYVEDLMSEGKISDVDQIREEDLPVVTLGDYLEDVSLLSAVDSTDGSEEDGDNKVALMTVHAAKGLEFPYVYVAGMEDGLFPSESMTSSPSDIEEERRLFYVAITRAKTVVTICYCSSRMRNGQTKEYPVSRFVREIDPGYLAEPLADPEDSGLCSGAFGRFGNGFASGSSDYASGGRAFRPGGSFRSGSAGGFRGGSAGSGGSAGGSRYPFRSNSGADAGSSRYSARPNSGSDARSAAQRPAARPSAPRPRPSDEEFVPVSILSLRKDMRIEHNRFGFGTILEISGSPADLKARIDFDDYGEKILLLKYAKIRMA